MENNSQRKSVDFRIKSYWLTPRMSKDLWCSVAYSPTCFKKKCFLIQISCQSKISQHVCLLIQFFFNKNILKFNISMHYFQLSEMFDSTCKIEDYSYLLLFLYFGFGCEFVVESPTGTVFGYGINKISFKERLIKSQNIRMIDRS